MKVNLKGFRELEEALVELEQVTGKTTAGRNALRRAATTAMEPLRLRMAQNAPFDPDDRDGDGQHLRDTMRTQPTKAKRRPGQKKFDRASNVEVMTGPAPVGKRARGNAGWQERGTVNMPPKGYITAAADAEGQGVVDKVTDLLAVEIEKAKQRIARKAAKAKG